MKQLDTITMICADCSNPGAAIAAIRKSLTQIKPARTIFFTDRQYNFPDFETIVIEPLKSKRDYSLFIVKQLHQYIQTSHVLIIQGDGHVLNGDEWDDEFLNWDVIGAPWPYDHDRRIANGGFSLRTKKLQEIVGTDDFIDVVHPEDQSLCIIYKFYLEEKYGIKFAPEELAEKFSYELIEPTRRTLGFHQYHWPQFQETVVISRQASLGDVIQTEPVMHYFHQKGYRVVLNTLPQFYELFRAHYFPVIPFGQLNPKIPYTHINLDLSYESDPKKLHLKAYYEFAGVPESEQVIRNPKLNFVVDHTNTLFPQKYCVIHIDERAQPGRNIYGVIWQLVIEDLTERGYLVIQIGKGTSEDTGAIKMQTLAEPMLAYVIAGCELFIGVDSGPANVAAATGRKMIVFHGAVSPKYIWPDMTNIRVITNHSEEKPICNNVYCWHSTIGCEGVPCYIDKGNPPCTKYDTIQVIDAINEML